jgi:hypothetical protein
MPEAGRQFRFIRPIASGGFGTVYLAKEEHADGFSRLVAIKLLNAQWCDSEELSGRLRDEARLLGILRHRNIVDVYDLTSLDGRPAVVMEYLEAVDTRFLMKHCTGMGVRIPARVGLEIVAAVAHALDAAYNRPPIKGEKPLRVIHRDIKPSNIMLDAHGLPKVLDFGVAQSEVASREANTQELQFGSVDYMAPERLFFEPETPASDVYSLAATLFELLAFERLGKAAGRASKHDAHLANRMSFLRGAVDAKPEVAAGLEALLLQALHFEHEQRPDAATFCQDARQLARRIEGLDMAMWAESHVGAAVEASQGRANDAESLSHSVLIEDSVVRDREVDTAELDTIRTIPEPVADRESARAAALRRGALAELEQSSDLPIAPATGAPKDGGGGKMADWTDGEGWNDRTMGDLTDAKGPPPEPADLPEPGGASGLDLVVAPEPGPVEDFEHTVTAVPDYDTITGLEPVQPRPPVLFLVLGAIIPLVIAVIFGVLMVVQDWGGFRTQFLGGSEPGLDVAPTVEEGADPASETLAAGAEEGGIRFVSRWAGTTKIRVRCKEESTKGGEEAWIDREAASRCSVTAMRADRSRITAVVDLAESGVLFCFEGGEKGCRPE